MVYRQTSAGAHIYYLIFSAETDWMPLSRGRPMIGNVPVDKHNYRTDEAVL